MSLTLGLWVELRPHTCQTLAPPPSNTSSPVFGILCISFELAWSLSPWQALGTDVNDEVALERDAFLEGKQERNRPFVFQSELPSLTWEPGLLLLKGWQGWENRFFAFRLQGTLIPSMLSRASYVRNRWTCLCFATVSAFNWQITCYIHYFTQYSWPLTHRGPLIPALIIINSQTTLSWPTQ